MTKHLLNRHRQLFAALLAATVAAVVVAESAHAGVISWNLDNNGTIGGPGAGDLPPLSAEAGVVQAGGWTNSFPSFLTTDLRDNTGAATTLDIGVFSSNGTFSVTGGNPGVDPGTGTFNRSLLNGYLNSGGGPVVGIDLLEIPYDQYEVYVYFNADVVGREGAITGTDGGLGSPVSTETFYFSTNAVIDSFVQATDTVDDVVDPGANYAVFSGTQSTFNLESQIPDFGGIAGFQVVEVIPEPASISLCGLMAVIGCLRRRARLTPLPDELLATIDGMPVQLTGVVSCAGSLVAAIRNTEQKTS